MAASYFPDRLKGLDGSLPPSPALSPSPAGQRSGALQNRITNVLSASYADLEIRDALETLDARQVHNTAETRRNLRLDAQQELIQCNGEIIRDFGQVSQQLQRVGAAIADLNKLCTTMRSHISAANRETGPTLEESSAMMTQRKQTDTKQQILQAFTSHFLLSDAEIIALTSTAEPVTETFFQALARVKKIHDDSQVLLGSEDQHLGLEILEQSSKQLNAAFQKLFRWTQRELRNLDLENPQLSTSVRRALRVLAERPALFQSCLDFFAENREQVLSDAFFAALTGGQTRSNVGGGKAIELSAHDPLRYVSDMLAWAHAATVGEREALQILFISDADEISKNIKASREREPWLQISEATDGDNEVAAFDGKKALNELVDRDLSGVLRQLRQRIEQVVQSHEDATLAYQISNLIRFYCSIFIPLLGSQSAIVQSLQPVTQKAFEQFKATMRDHIANIHSDVAVTPLDLTPPEFLIEALETLKGLMKSYDTSLAGVVKGEEGTIGFQPVLEEALDPYLAGCESIAKGMGQPQSQILAINCLNAAKDTLKSRTFTEERQVGVEEAIGEQAEKLIQTVHSWFVAESGLKPLLRALEEYRDVDLRQERDGIRKLRELQPVRLADTAQKLDAFLPGAMEDGRSFIGKLTDKRLVRKVCEKAADIFVEEFEEAERILVGLDELSIAEDGEEMEEGSLLRDVFPRTSDEIRVLLS